MLEMQEKRHISKDYPNKQKDQVDAFFIGMSVNKDEYKFHQKTPSKQANYKEHLRERAMTQV